MPESETCISESCDLSKSEYNIFFSDTKTFYSSISKKSPKKINKETLLKRRKFLAKHNLLKNPICSTIGMEGKIRERKIYGNHHLYPHSTTNIANMLQGRAPINEQNDIITIHHLDQRHYGDWVIMPSNFHRSYDAELHSKHSVIGGVQRSKFNKERKLYWKFEATRISKLAANEDNTQNMSCKI